MIFTREVRSHSCKRKCTWSIEAGLMQEQVMQQLGNTAERISSETRGMVEVGVVLGPSLGWNAVQFYNASQKECSQRGFSHYVS